MTSRQDKNTNLTGLLRQWGAGDRSAFDELFPMVYGELRQRAARYLRRERPNHTLQTTGLVHEAYLKLADQRQVGWKNRGHFFALAAQAMRRILVDHARSRNRGKRGGQNECLALEEAEVMMSVDNIDVDLIALDEALTRLETVDPDQRRLVELRFFAGLTLEEAAEVMGVSRSTAANEWQMAKAWLHRELTRL